MPYFVLSSLPREALTSWGPQHAAPCVSNSRHQQAALSQLHQAACLHSHSPTACCRGTAPALGGTDQVRTAHYDHTP